MPQMETGSGLKTVLVALAANQIPVIACGKWLPLWLIRVIGTEPYLLQPKSGE